MSVKEHKWLTGTPHKPASEMTPAEWEEFKAEVDAARAAEGQEPIRWHRFTQPQPLTEADRERARKAAVDFGLIPA
jgi:hypothetical protein